MAFDGKLFESIINKDDDLKDQIKLSLKNIEIGVAKLDIELKFKNFIEKLKGI